MFNLGRFDSFFRAVLNSERRFSTSSFLQSRLQTIRDRAVRQQIDWIRSTNPIKHANRTDTTVYRDQCKIPFKLPCTEPKSDLLDDINSHSYQGKLEEMIIDYFGSITAEHGDILNETGDCLVVPIPPNLTPHCGFGIFQKYIKLIGLKVLELGGKKLVKALVQRSKLIISERVKELELMKDSFKYQNEYKSSLLEARTLQIGTLTLYY